MAPETLEAAEREKRKQAEQRAQLEKAVQEREQARQDQARAHETQDRSLQSNAFNRLQEAQKRIQDLEQRQASERTQSARDLDKAKELIKGAGDALDKMTKAPEKEKEKADQLKSIEQLIPKADLSNTQKITEVRNPTEIPVKKTDLTNSVDPFLMGAIAAASLGKAIYERVVAKPEQRENKLGESPDKDSIAKQIESAKQSLLDAKTQVAEARQNKPDATGPDFKELQRIEQEKLRQLQELLQAKLAADRQRALEVQARERSGR